MPRPHPFGAAMAFADRRVGGAPEKADFNRPAQSRHTNNNSPNQARPAYHLCYRGRFNFLGKLVYTLECLKIGRP